MNKHLLLLGLVLLMLSSKMSFSQEGRHPGQMNSPVPENFFSAAPDVMAFQKYSLVPVSLYTGKIDLSIPIFEIKSGGITVPISISYNSGGIKVDDIASSVGTGWNLNAGGSIIRTIKDLHDNEGGFRLAAEPDDDVGLILEGWVSSIGYNRKPGGVNSYQNFFYNSAVNGKHATYIDDPRMPTVTGPVSPGGNHPGYGLHVDDMSPDVFFANAPGLSTQFTSVNTSAYNVFPDNNNGFTTTFLDNSGNKMESLVMDKRDVDGLGFIDLGALGTDHFGRAISPILDFFEFNITNTNGLKYKFDQEEVTESFYQPYGTYVISPIENKLATYVNNNYSKRIHTWNLSKIEDPTSNKTVNFNYDTFQNSNEIHNTFVNTEVVLSPTIESNGDCYYQQQEDPTNLPGYNESFGSYSRNIKRKRLTSISFDEGEVLFIYNTDRLDNLGEKQLDEIHIKNINNEIIKKIKFVYSYFDSKENCSDPECKRLRLDKVEIFNGDTNKLNDYEFDYEYTNKLPKRGSLQQDYLGYYNNNGQTTTSGSSAIYTPTLYFYENQGRLAVLPFQRTDISSHVLIPGDYNLVPNSYSLTGLLKKVTFPTGGSTEFEYENNTFQLNGHEYTSGGGRIKKQTLKDSDGTVAKVLDYEYKDANNKSSGYINNIPVYGYLESFNISPFAVGSFDVYDKPKSGIELTSGSYVGYSRVIEKETGNGYTEYTYSSPENDANVPETRTATSGGTSWPVSNSLACSSSFISNNAYPNAIYIDNDFKRGKLETKKVFDEQDNILLAQVNEYTSRTFSTLSLQKDFKIQAEKYNSIINIGDEGKLHILDVNSQLLTAQDLITKTTTTEYLDGGNKITEAFFAYDNTYPFLTQKRTVDDVGELKTDTYYPFSSGVSGQSYMTDLVNANRLYETVKEEVRRDDNLILTQQTNYQNFGNGLILPKSLSVAKGAETLEEGSVIDLRDDNGNILQYHDKAGVYTSIIWGYDQTYPIAKIENASYSQIEGLSAFGSSFTITDGLSTSQDSALRGLTGALVTTYEYDPLIGITTMTDPRGRTVTYEYDSFNRLEYVKDHDGNILSKNKYHYKD